MKVTDPGFVGHEEKSDLITQLAKKKSDDCDPDFSQPPHNN